MADDESMIRTLGRIYARASLQGHRLSWHEKLTSIWRPYYAPFNELMQWIPIGSSILDIGCGSGAFLFLCADRRNARKCVGIDANARAIELANLVSISPEHSFTIGTDVPSDLLEAADVITMIDVLHHIPRDAKVRFLNSVLSSAQGGATIIVKDLDPSPLWMSTANRVTDYLSTRSRVDYIARSDVEKSFLAAGIDVIHSKDLRKHVWSHYIVVGQMKSKDRMVASA